MANGIVSLILTFSIISCSYGKNTSIKGFQGKWEVKSVKSLLKGAYSGGEWMGKEVELV